MRVAVIFFPRVLVAQELSPLAPDGKAPGAAFCATGKFFQQRREIAKMARKMFFAKILP
ncbi:MAG: hypothetical protein K2G99_06820 [Desulfovibrio sp.]|nr:hypothetical protein [Desulfovibrio sp.]